MVSSISHVGKILSQEKGKDRRRKEEYGGSVFNHGIT
jgi:hypothetical protein